MSFPFLREFYCLVIMEELNYVIGKRGGFANGKTYELIDLEQGNDLYCILFCPAGYKFPKWALFDEEKADRRDRGESM